MKPVVFHPEAQDEFDDAANYYDRQQPGLGDEFRDEVDLAIHRIQVAPRAAGLYPGTPCRKKLVDRFDYKLVYLELDDRILLLAAHHNRRRPGYWLPRLADI